MKLGVMRGKKYRLSGGSLHHVTFFSIAPLQQSDGQSMDMVGVMVNPVCRQRRSITGISA